MVQVVHMALVGRGCFGRGLNSIQSPESRIFPFSYHIKKVKIIYIQQEVLVLSLTTNLILTTTKFTYLSPWIRPKHHQNAFYSFITSRFPTTLILSSILRNRLSFRLISLPTIDAPTHQEANGSRSKVSKKEKLRYQRYQCTWTDGPGGQCVEFRQPTTVMIVDQLVDDKGTSQVIINYHWC